MRGDPGTKGKTLEKLGRHPYGVIRENVARHPNADATTLTYLSKDRSQPLWYLVAFHPNTPSVLQRRLRERIKHLAASHNAIRYIQSLERCSFSIKHCQQPTVCGLRPL